MTEIPEDTLSRMRDLSEQISRLQQRRELMLVTLLDAEGLDPSQHQADLEEGVIREVEE